MSGGCVMNTVLPDGRPRVLVVDDQPRDGLALDDAIEQAGFGLAGPFSHCDRAAQWLAQNTPDLAILDVRLMDGFCTDVARELRRRGVIFLVYSGWSQGTDTGPEFQDAPWFDKPSAYADVVTALTKMAPAGPQRTQP